MLWGSEECVRKLFGERVEFLQLARPRVRRTGREPREYVALFEQTLGPVLAIYDSLADQPDRSVELDHDFLEFADRANSAPAEYRYEHCA